MGVQETVKRVWQRVAAGMEATAGDATKGKKDGHASFDPEPVRCG